MLCHKCRATIDDGSTFCPYCGTQTGAPGDTEQQQQSYYQNNQQYGQSSQQYNQAPAQPKNTLALVGFILSFFASVPGLILSILGYKAAKNGAPNMSLAKAGIIISSISIGVSVLIGIIYGSVLSAALGGILAYGM